jgi:hypothetical protein
VTPFQLMDFKSVMAGAAKDNVKKVIELDPSALGKQVGAVATKDNRD